MFLVNDVFRGLYDQINKIGKYQVYKLMKIGSYGIYGGYKVIIEVILS